MDVIGIMSATGVIFCRFFMVKIAERIERVKETIASACARAGRDPAEVTLVVVTKSATLEAIEEVIRLGCLDLGENRVQQLKKSRHR